MRGKGRKSRRRNRRDRITPAYAGKSRCHSAGDYTHGDHPRLCGEKYRHQRFRRRLMGSPPPMRGKVVVKRELSQVDGITPAYAGKR